jgi:uncharacterized membrane protein
MMHGHGEPGPLADSIRGALHRHGDELRAQRKRLRDAQHAVHAALGADPYDPQTLQQALSALRDATVESQRSMHGVLIEVAGTLPVEQRRALLRDVKALRDWQQPEL